MAFTKIQIQKCVNTGLETKKPPMEALYISDKCTGKFRRVPYRYFSLYPFEYGEKEVTLNLCILITIAAMDCILTHGICI